MTDQDGARAAFRARVQETKARIAAMLGSHALPGSDGVITIALLERGIERHLRVGSTEQSVRDLFDGVVQKVREENTGRACGNSR